MTLWSFEPCHPVPIDYLMLTWYPVEDLQRITTYEESSEVHTKHALACFVRLSIAAHGTYVSTAHDWVQQGLMVSTLPVEKPQLIIYFRHHP